MPPIRTFTLNDPYALEALSDRTPSMLPRVRKEYPKEVLTEDQIRNVPEWKKGEEILRDE